MIYYMDFKTRSLLATQKAYTPKERWMGRWYKLKRIVRKLAADYYLGITTFYFAVLFSCLLWTVLLSFAMILMGYK